MDYYWKNSVITPYVYMQLLTNKNLANFKQFRGVITHAQPPPNYVAIISITFYYNCTWYSGDYSIGPYSVYVAAGVTNISFGIGIHNDNDIERNEIFNIFIDATSLPYNIILDDDINSATVTILDDDCELYM